MLRYRETKCNENDEVADLLKETAYFPIIRNMLIFIYFRKNPPITCKFC